MASIRSNFDVTIGAMKRRCSKVNNELGAEKAEFSRFYTHTRRRSFPLSTKENNAQTETHGSTTCFAPFIDRRKSGQAHDQRVVLGKS